MTGHLCTFAGVVAFALVSFASGAAAAQDNVVLSWNTAMLQAIRNTGSNPVFTARGFAILHTCMYDAWAAYDAVAVGTRLGGSLREPESEHTLANKEKAVSFAAYTALIDLFAGSQKDLLFDPLIDCVRPITAVRYLYAGRTIDAWAGPGLGTQPIAGENFRSYIATPPFAEYTSGHSAFSAASARILERFTGSPAFGASHTVPAGSSPVEPGVAPTADVTLSWATFEDAANQAGVSRRYGGIHFHDGDLESRKMGRQIGSLVWTRAQTYFDGTAVAPLVSRAETR
jgi:hypothetical protein